MVIGLSYCEGVNEGLPCRNIIGCWGKRVDIVSLLKARFTEEELRKAFGGPPKSRIERIVEAIEKARDKKA